MIEENPDAYEHYGARRPGLYLFGSWPFVGLVGPYRGDDAEPVYRCVWPVWRVVTGRMVAVWIPRWKAAPKRAQESTRAKE